MDRSLGDLVGGLIPTWSGPIPPELLELARGLLAQSRSKIGNLKAEEEIARPYACANLACNRLKQQLKLPKIESRPPCPPRVYTKLYKYFDSQLSSDKRRTVGSSQPQGNGPIGQNRDSSTPRKPQSTRQLSGKNTSTKSSKASNGNDPPPWVMPTIRGICKKLEAPAAPHHIFSGVASILASVQENGAPSDPNIPAVIVVVYIFATTRLSGVAMTDDKYPRLRQQASDVMRDALSGQDEPLDWDDAQIDECMRQFKKYRWFEMDWFQNVPIGAGLKQSDGGPVVEDEVGSDEDDPMIQVAGADLVDAEAWTEDYLLPGLGTMMDEKLDYLSEARIQSYEKWKAKILQRIESMSSQKE